MELLFGANEVFHGKRGESAAKMERNFQPTPGGPFSAVISLMWPMSVIDNLQEAEEADAPPEYRYDEFGFRVDIEDGSEEFSSKILGIPLVEDPQHRLQWQAHLEFALNSNVENLTWDKVGTTIPHSEKLSQLVRQGIPHSIRAEVWTRLSGALQKRNQSDATYREIVEASCTDKGTTLKAIEKDLLRTIPNNACFSNKDSPGIAPLRRILTGLSWLYPDNGYCQGTGMIVSHLLLIMPEEYAFWTMCAIIENLVPSSYFNNSLLGVHADQRSLRQLLMQYLPKIDTILQEHDIELSLITLHWFITLFAGVLHTKVLLRVWDLFFLDGSIVLFKVALGMLKLKETVFEGIVNSADIFNCLSDIPSLIDDAEHLLEISFKTAGSLTSVVLDTHRRKHIAYLLSEQGKHSSANSSQPRKQMLRRRSFIGKVIFGSSIDDGYEHDKAKNIIQTELVSSLRNTIKTIMKHFQDDNDDDEINIEADYSLQSHGKDHEEYLNVSLNKRRRAKALLNFERHDDSELGFKKNDIITVVNMKDEHCWIGELNGLRGWFPAKLVQLLDERSKTYTTAGDDSVSRTITDLIRGGLCPVIQSILEHGLKRPLLLGTACHPWQFIEEVANHEVEKDFESVFSRLVLCKTFRLDEEGKVLTPEELLYRCVQSVNMTHENVQMDVKLRSLICLGLNEQILHLWLEVLCSCESAVTKWYQPWSFIRSPGWVLLKCELRVLAKTTFYLSQDWELPKKKTSELLREGVRDMLVKHHLFSWDI